MNLTKSRKTDYLLILVFLAIAFFFRFWMLKNFQYWSDDEQFLWFTIRHIAVDKHPSLVTANSALELGLGPLFHYIVLPWYWLVKFDPKLIGLLGNIFTVLGLTAIYKAGQLFKDRKTGCIAAFLYSASFMSSIFDRRLWALSPNFIVVTLTIISIFKIISGKTRYIFLLLPAFILPFNSDPSLLVATIASMLVILLFRIKIDFRFLFLFFILTVTLLSPLIIFEIKHGGSNINSLRNLLLLRNRQTRHNEKQQVFTIEQLTNFSRFIYAKPTKTAEIYFSYTRIENRNTLPALIIFLVLILITYRTFKTHDKKMLTLIIFLVTYLGGVYIFKTTLKRDSEFFYSLTVSPVIFLILSRIISSQKSIITFIIVTLYLAANIHSLINSEIKYPLGDKMKLVQQASTQINPGEDFSLYYSGDIFLAGGGWTSLFSYQNITPAKGSLSQFWGHVYDSYQLYPKKFKTKEPNKVVLLSEKEVSNKLPIIYSNKIGKVYLTIIDNEKDWFKSSQDIEKLYIPTYY